MSYFRMFCLQAGVACWLQNILLIMLQVKRYALSKSQNERNNPMEHPCHQLDGGAPPQPLHHMLDELLEVVRHEPVSAAGLVKIGESCFRYDLTTSAAGFFQAALMRDPRCSDAMNNMGVMAFSSGDYKNAESLFMDALETAPDFREARQNLAQLYSEAPHLAARQEGNAFHCPCCGGFFPGFIAGGPVLRPKACCPRCGSLERHRLLWLYLQEKTDFFTRQLSVLHVAPESIFQEQFRKVPNLDYISADIASPLAMVKMDITDIQFPNNTFDVILCSHVLEHIPDDRLAIRELYRVLKPGGWAILQVPIDTKRESTYEDPAITSAEDRKKYFGQDDHVRWYGNDYSQRLREGGFEIEEDNFSRQIDANSIEQFGLIHETVFIGKKLSHQKNNYMSDKSLRNPRYLREKKATIQSFNEFLSNKSTPRWPINLFIEISNTCNLSCVMCHQFSLFNTRRFIDFSSVRRGMINFDMLKDNLSNILPYVLNANCFGYGEATIHPRFRDIIEYVSSFDVLIHFYTNGMTMDEDMCEFIVRQGVHHVTFSFTGNKKEIYENIYIGGNFDTVLNSMKLLAEKKAQFGTKYPIISVNSLSFIDHVKNIDDFIILMHRHGVNRILLQQLFSDPNTPQLFKHIGVMRNWADKERLDRAKSLAKSYGIVFSCESFERSAIDEPEMLHHKIAEKIGGKGSVEDKIERLLNQPELPLKSFIQYGKSLSSERPAHCSANSVDSDFTYEPGGQHYKKYDLNPICFEPFQTLYICQNGELKPCCYWNSGAKRLSSLQSTEENYCWDHQGLKSLRENVIQGNYPENGCGHCIELGLRPKSNQLNYHLQNYKEWLSDKYGSILGL